MKDSQIFPFCRKNGIKLPASWRHSLNAVRYHNRNETEEHFMAKAQLAHKLMSKGQTIFTELEFFYNGITGNRPRMNFPVCDLLWLEEKIIVEFETKISAETLELKHSQFKDFNVHVISLKNLDMEELYDKLGV